MQISDRLTNRLTVSEWMICFMNMVPVYLDCLRISPKIRSCNYFCSCFYFIDANNTAVVMTVQGGVVLLLVAVCTNVGYNTASKSLSVDVGGAKRLHALSSAMSACLLLPWMLFILFTRQVDSVVQSFLC